MIVHPEGRQDARLILLGEAPGRWEAEQGRPFVGPAGNLLNNILQSAGLQRVLGSDLYITNVLKEKPPDTKTKSNDITSIINVSKKTPIESPAWHDALAKLKVELEQCSSSTIVAFGNVPLYALTEIFPPKITKRRGSVYPCTLVPGKKVVATIHPAACLHGGGQGGGMYIWQHFILHDVKKAVRESKVEGIIQSPIHNHVCNSFAQAIDFLQDAMKHHFTTTIDRVISFDIEVISLEVSHISIAFGNFSLSIPFIKDGQEFFSPDQEVELWSTIASILEAPNIQKIGQNLMFDTQFLFRKYGIRTKNIQDTMIAHAVLIPDFPKGLDFINSIYGTEPYYKDEGKLYLSSGGSDEQFALYNAKDSAVCLEAFPKILDDLRILGNEEAYGFQRDLVECLLYMSERGIRMDVEGLEKAVYHNSIKSHLLEELQKGDFSKLITQAALGQEMCLMAATVFIWTAIFTRSKWRYAQRAYRYIYLDAGHIAQNLALSATSLGLGSCQIGALYDDEVNKIIEVDGSEESVIYISAVGYPR